MTTSKESTASPTGTPAEPSVSLVSNHNASADSTQASALSGNPSGENRAVEVIAPNTETRKKASKGKVKFEAKLQREEAVTYFRALVDGLSAGYLSFKQGSDSLELTPCSPLHVEVKGSAKGSRQKVSFEIEWELNGEATLQIQH